MMPVSDNAVAIVTDYGHDWKYDYFSITTDHHGIAYLELDEYRPEEVPWYEANRELPVIVLAEGRVLEFEGRPHVPYMEVRPDDEIQFEVEITGGPYTVYSPIHRVNQTVAV